MSRVCAPGRCCAAAPASRSRRAGPAHAGLFDDDEARRAILDLRKQLEQSNEQARARQNEQMAQMSAQIDQLKRSLLDLNGADRAQRADNAKLRGQIEELARDVAELQRKQTDIAAGRRRAHPQGRAAEGDASTTRSSASTPRRSAATTTRWRAFARASSTAPRPASAAC